MDSYVVNIDISIRRQANGSYVALGEKLPIMVVARDLESLREKLSGVGRSVGDYLGRADDAMSFMKERGIEPRHVGPETGEITIPVLVDA